MKLNTCHHSFDNGSFCKSPALRGRDYCCYHLNHRGRLMHIARKRAQNQRLFLTLPPLENMHAVQSALSQVLEAVAADMIDLKRAQFLLTGLRHAASNFKNPKAWLPSAYVNDPEAPGLEAYPEFEAEYELPNNLNLATRPEVAFPPPPEETMAAAQLPADSNSGDGTFSTAKALELVNNPLQTTPADIELEEIWKNEGFAAHEVRAREHQRNERRRNRRQNFRANYARYEAEANARNIRNTVERLLREKLAAEKSAATLSPSDGCPVQGRELALDGSLPAPDGASKKPPAVAPESVQKEPSKTA